ncbi:MAG: carboxylating nicotinate-nucleotide diphosphorylase [Pirellulaceae bacterium]
MKKEFHQIDWDQDLTDDCRQLVKLAVREDLGREYDWTTMALVPSAAQGQARLVSRQAGVVAGLAAIPIVLDEMEVRLEFQSALSDGDALHPGSVLGTLSGHARDLLVTERLILNLVGKLSGIATLGRQFVDAIRTSQAKIYDTRKTTPGYRRLEKYAAGCGGVTNHRTGLFEAIMIKDNHLAFAGQAAHDRSFSARDAVEQAKAFVAESLPKERAAAMIIEVEVDTLPQLRQVLPALPDIVLLDNMAPDMLSQAVQIRNEVAPQVQLEASGGVNLSTVLAIAQSGVERISVGAITHSAVNLDVGLDWAV